MDSDSNSNLNEIKEDKEDKWSGKFSEIDEKLKKMIGFIQNEIDNLDEYDKIFSELEDEVKNMKEKNGTKLIQKSYNSNVNIYSSHNYYINNPQEQNYQDEIEEDDHAHYSYECTNIKDLFSEIYEGKNQTSIIIKLKNNGKYEWPEGKAKIIFDKDSKIKLNDIELEPQNPEEERSYNIELSELRNYKADKYEIDLGLFINEKICGDKLTLSIIIKSKNDNVFIIDQFRKNFNLPSESCSDEMILEHLEKNNYNDNKTYIEIINAIN